jgi:type I restriction enzyme S subunit
MEVKPGYKPTEVGVIPEEWDVSNLGALVSYTNGKAHEQSITDSGKFVVVNSKFISTEGLVRKYTETCLCPASKDDVLMVMSDVPNGKAIAKCYWVESDNTYTVNQRICALTPRSINGRLLFYKLDRNPFYLAFDDGAKQTNLRKNEVLACPLGFPRSDAEQRAIAEPLRDVDALLGALDRLIAKKRDLKQAARQQLLTGQTRLPGFHGEWEVKTIQALSHIGRGRVISHREISRSSSPAYPVFSSQTSNDGIMGYLHTYDFEGDYVTWTTDGANAGTVFARSGRFSCTNVCGTIKLHNSDHRFIAAALGRVSQPHVSRHLGNPKLMNDVMKKIAITIPKTRAEQTAIADVLADMDAELVALERRREKTRDLKQAMMQALLTGKTRLVPAGAVHA